MSASLLSATVEELHKLGGGEREAFVLWGGSTSTDGCELTVTSAVRPAQTASSTPDGLLVTVDGDSLFAMNKHFHSIGELLVGQVHTHPGEAYHSKTDDDFPLVTLVGAISVVIPDFGRHGLQNQHRWAWYRLMARGSWERLDQNTDVRIT